MATFGFIGTGNMGGALARAVCKTVESDQVFLCNRTMEKAQKLADALLCRTADAQAIATSADFILLGVKPYLMEGLLAQLSPCFTDRDTRFVLVSMAAGLTIADLNRMSGMKDFPIIRIMPNTPSAVGEGVLLYSCSNAVTKNEVQEFVTAFSASGSLMEVDEHLIDAGSAVAGCGPAFVALVMEAMADAGVACGLPRTQALELAARTLIGTGRLALETNAHPGQIKDGVCSPGGATIEGIRAMENHGVRAGMMKVVYAAYRRTTELA